MRPGLRWFSEAGKGGVVSAMYIVQKSQRSAEFKIPQIPNFVLRMCRRGVLLTRFRITDSLIGRCVPDESLFFNHSPSFDSFTLAMVVNGFVGGFNTNQPFGLFANTDKRSLQIIVEAHRNYQL